MTIRSRGGEPDSNDGRATVGVQRMQNTIIDFIRHYGFDFQGTTAPKLVAGWCMRFSTAWTRLAAIEALYQGRYKAVSIEQILTTWARSGQARCHFTGEFERMVCRHVLAPSPEDIVDTDLSANRIPALELPPYIDADTTGWATGANGGDRVEHSVSATARSQSYRKLKAIVYHSSGADAPDL
ncbi:hypothetical protein [Rubidibacter lacunae]|uniref:hypothetical protein n=1 Tax=Rubidibacter lacunae TaxID=582514 RepID=UPI001E5EFA0F|nr:hypothetical protein [Rubidibacter lacunae]